MSQLEYNKKRIFFETSVAIDDLPSETSRRYIAKAYSVSGPGWGVWDCKKYRYLSIKEIEQLTDRQIEELE